jgi:hypothetical protein
VQHGTNAHVDEAMGGAGIEADRRGAGARMLHAKARATARAWRHAAERRHFLRRETVLSERGRDLRFLGPAIGILGEMLQRAATAGAEMRANRCRTLARRQYLDELAGASLAALGAKPRAHAIAGRGQGNIDRTAGVAGDAVAAPADAVDDQCHLRRALLPHGGVRRA